MRIAHWLVAIVSVFVVGAPGVQAQNLVSNGGFESGLTGWSTWTVSNGFWNGSWIHSNDCDIWVPTNGCPLTGTISHAQKKGSGGGNTHGGLYQTISVVPGRDYAVTGNWSGGATGNVAGANGSWWEVVVFDGAVNDAIIDAGTRPQDVQIVKREANNLGNNAVYQFQWEPFAGVFTARSSTVTLVLKAGSFSTFDAAAYHDNLSVVALAPPIATPTLTPAWLVALALLLAGSAAWLRLRRR